MPKLTEQERSMLGQRLKECRGTISRQKFAPEIGTNPESLRLYEEGTRLPDLEVLAFLRRNFRVSLDWLVDGQESASAPLDSETLASIIRGIEAETPNLDPVAKAKLIVRFYEEFRDRRAESPQNPQNKKAAG